MRKNKIFKVDTTKFKAMELKDNPEFYSRDTDAYLTFTVPDESFEFDQALLYLINIDDGSVIPDLETVILGQANVEYEIPSEIMAHYGRWKGQIVFQKDGEKASSAIFDFIIKRFLTDERPPTLNEVESIAKLRREAKELIEELEKMTYDPESLTDVLLAKDGELTLDARIRRDVNNLENKKADKAEVSAQLAQTKDDLEYKINEDVQGLEGNINQALSDKNKHRPIFVGMSEPLNDLGENGDLYLQTYADNEIRFYEEGTFTPRFTGSIAPQEVNYAKQSGRYIRIGDLVTVFIDIELTSLIMGSGAGEFRIYGLPYSSKIAQDIPFGGVLLGLDLGENNKVLRAFRLGQSSGFMTLAHSVMNGITNGAPLIPLNTIQNNFKLSTSFTYLATKNETMPLEKLV